MTDHEFVPAPGRSVVFQVAPGESTAERVPADDDELKAKIEKLEATDGDFIAHDPVSGHVWPVAADYVELHYEDMPPEPPPHVAA